MGGTQTICDNSENHVDMLMESIPDARKGYPVDIMFQINDVPVRTAPNIVSNAATNNAKYVYIFFIT